MHKLFFFLASLSAFISVAFGAFGAHVLKQRITPDMLAVFETGVRYQMYHAFGLALVAFAWKEYPLRLVSTSGVLFIAGTVLFSGSLYVLALTGIKWMGAITPFGGISFLAGWGCLAMSVLNTK